MSAVLKKIFGEGWYERLLREEEDSQSRTPDIWKIQNYKVQRVFIPDNLQARHKENAVLEPFGTLRAKAFTLERFAFFKKKLGAESFPIMFEERFRTAPHARIMGELYDVRSPSGILMLDNYKDNGIQFVRTRIKLLVPFRRVHVGGGGTYFPQVQVIPAWAYIGKLDYWEDQLDGGMLFSPVRTYAVQYRKDRPDYLKENYYAFTRIEYKT